MTRRRLVRGLVHLIGPAVFVWLLIRVDTGAVARRLADADAALVAAAVALLLPAVAARAWRWALLARQCGAHLTRGEALRAYMFGIVAGIATPGRLGELTKAKVVSDRGATTADAVMTVVVDRALDMAFLTAVALAGAIFIRDQRGLSALLIALVALLAAFAGSAALCLPAVRRVLEARWAGATGWRGRIRDFYSRFAVALWSIDGSVWLRSVGATSIAWSLNWISVFLLARALHLPLSLWLVFAISALSSVVAMLPISFLGAGTRDVVVIAALRGTGVGPEGALAFSTAMLALVLMNGLLCAVAVSIPARTWRW